MRRPELLVLALLVSACRGQIAVGPPVVAPVPELVGAMRARDAIVTGLMARRFAIVGEQPGVVEARLDSRRMSVSVRVRYAAERYAIEYVDSSGLDAHLDEAGVLRVSANYHRYVERLRASIDASFTQPVAPGSIPAPPWYAAPATGPPAPTTGPSTSGGAASALGVAAPPPGSATAPPPSTEGTATAPPPPIEGTATAPPPPATPPPAAVPPLDPETGGEPERRYETHPLWELAIPGAVVLGGSWVGNWIAALAVGGSRSEYQVLSFVPFGGPWAQLSTLQWSIHPRWTGWFHPLMGVLQVAGVAMLVVGLVVPVREDRSSARAGEVRWNVTPFASADAAGLSLDGTF